MALTSPGVQVSVIDESFYTPAEPGTRPLFIVASAENKSNGSGTGTAQGTLAANAGKVYLITSQRDLADTFGDPTFQVDANNNPVHAGELNEYGLQAAYSYLGVSNSAFVVRADLDLTALTPSANAPGGEPVDGTFWLDSASSAYGIFEWNGAAASTTGGQSFTNKVPSIVTTGVPSDSTGAIGTYALAHNDTNTTTGHEITLYYKSAFAADGTTTGASWAVVGSAAWVASKATVSSTIAGATLLAVGDEAITVSIDDGISYTNILIGVAESSTISVASIVTAFDSLAPAGVAARAVNGILQIYVTNSSVDSIKIGVGSSTTLLTAFGIALTDAGVLRALPVEFYAPKLQISKHTDVPTWKNKAGQTPRPTGAIWVKTTEPNLGARWRVKVYNSATQLWDSIDAPLYASNHAALVGIDVSGGGANIAVNSAYVQYDFNADATVTFRLQRRARAGATTVRTAIITTGTIGAGSYTIQLGSSRVAAAGIYGVGADLYADVTFVATGVAADADLLAGAINTANIDNISATVTAGRVVISHAIGGEIRFTDAVGSLALAAAENNANVYAVLNDGNFAYNATNWAVRTFAGSIQSYYISGDAPATLEANGALWYSSVVDEVDLMVNNGGNWVGYVNFYAGTDPEGPIVSASQPTTFADGVTEISAVSGDGQIWIDTSDLENYPTIKRWDSTLVRWETLDKSDQTTENGVLFADARWSTAGTDTDPATIAALLTSNFLDFDAPDPALYPRGMVLWNLRRSGFNVKRFARNYVDLTADNGRQSDVSMASYYPHRWVTESGNQNDGSGSFGRHAQRKVVIQSLQALVNSNQELRDTEVRTFNLLATPGYSELIGEMITLNYDRGLTAFVVGDTPARLTPDATSINDWGNNVALALQDDDSGLVSYDEYLGVFYPWGFTSDNAGNDIAVPPSHMILRMIALNDQVAYPWFAPAGTRRGGITNASAVGYVTAEGEFSSVALNEGQRDALYNVKVNPITFFTGAGLVNFGQKTRARNASALDRINVARLVIYLRSQLNKLAKPYIFEPNDKITRDEIKQQVGQRALYDFLVVCDESNNTPNRIDRNELYVDIAIEPVKAVEFIYIPVRLKNTGEIAGLG
jgi:hypothetical protein